MAETFYSVLGVAADADAEAIRRAYRERVKEHHPDVSDDPAAPDEFKRLTTAKEVLVDESERRRYDRLGHADYVRDHVDSSVWRADSSGRRSSSRTSTTATGTTKSAPSGTTHATSSRRRTAGTRTTGTGTTDTARDTRHRSSRSRGRRGDRRGGAGAATTAAEDWQHASATYRRADTSVATGRQSTLRSVLSGLLSVGPWLFVHLIFIGSAAATAYLAVTTADAHVTVSWPTLLAGVLLLGAVVFVSVLHVVSQLYS